LLQLRLVTDRHGHSSNTVLTLCHVCKNHCFSIEEAQLLRRERVTGLFQNTSKLTFASLTWHY